MQVGMPIGKVNVLKYTRLDEVYSKWTGDSFQCCEMLHLGGTAVGVLCERERVYIILAAMIRSNRKLGM